MIMFLQPVIMKSFEDELGIERSRRYRVRFDTRAQRSHVEALDRVITYCLRMTRGKLE
jgi:hypothetical protein